MIRALAAGTMFDRRFRIVRPLGTSFSAETYEAVRVETARRVALRLIHDSLADFAPFADRFDQSIAQYRSLRDEVVAIEDAGRATHGTMFVATEFMETRCVVGAPVPWQRVAAIMMRICGALDAMQAAGIADRRLDTTKVYWSGSEEQAKLDAVGLLLDGRDLPAPDAGEGVRRWWPGVQIPASWLEYASPERLMGKSLDARSDVYSAGVVAYELLTGRRPFAEAVGPAGLITMQLKRVPAPPSCVIPDIPTACDDVVLRCLAKARDDRYPDPRALRDALRALA